MADSSTSPISQPSVMNVDQLNAQPLPRQPQPPYYSTQSQLPAPPTMAEVQPPPPGLSPRPIDFSTQQSYDLTPPPQYRTPAPSMTQAIGPVKEGSAPTKTDITSLPPIPSQVTIPKKPPQMKKSTQPLHLLLLECCKEYITGNLATKSEEDIKELLNDRKKLHADLQLYCTDVVLTSARDRILNELDERGKEALKDISPDSEIIKLRFEEAAALHKNFTDAVEELKLKSTGPDEVMQDTPSTEDSDANKPSEPLAQVFRLWEQINKNDVMDNLHAAHMDQSRNRGRGQNRGGYWQQRGAPRHAPYQNQAQGQRRRDWGARDDRDYRERRGDEHYNRDRRDEYPRRDYDRRQDFRGPPTPSPTFNRERPQMGRRDDSYHRNYDDRRRDSYDRRPDDNRHPRDHRGPPLPLTIGPPKPSPSIYEAPPMPPMPPNVPNPSIQSPQQGYDYASYSTDQQYSSVYPGYFPQYPQDSSANGQSYQYSTVSTSAGWDTQTNPLQSVPIQLASFNWNQPGRHTAIPLPTDFMSGPSNAPRLSMPEPHDVLGVIKGVIIRDAQGNIGLSQYQFSSSM
ncbi:8383_t:CDS:2 [Cetraspora pellucida]|uniref:8383_t:CDS:1 n=1 Tax=Cetraspora pellucida TaxID=1433469 RepID=A0A9N9ER63_9GLOM|nr:8383_t:CDS:2 [Cetraspora pellucida]